MSVENDILIVGDETPNLRLLSERLKREGYKVRRAESGQMALDSALAKPPGLILLKMQMPEMDGLEVCQRLKEDRRTGKVPIIFVSTKQDDDTRIKGFEAGGVDFLTKPFHEQEVLARVKNHLRLHQMQQNMERLVEERTAEMMTEFLGRQRAEDKYHAFVKKSSEGIWAYDLKEPIPMDLPVGDQFDLLYERAYISEANDSMARILGFKKAEDLLGMCLDDFQPRTNPENVAYVKDVIREKYNVTDFELMAFGSDGEKRIMFNNTVGIIKNGKLLRIWGTSRDVTELKRKEIKLQQSERRFRYLMEQSPLAMEILNPDGKIVQINKAWLQLWGVNTEDAKKTTASYNMLEDEQTVELGVAPLVRKAFAGEPVILPMIEYSGQRSAEDLNISDLKVKTVWIQCHLFPIKNKEGEVEFVVNMYNDLSAQIKANQERERILKLSKDLICIAGNDGYLKYVNPAWEIILGYSAKELLEHPYLDFVHPEDLGRAKQELQSLTEGHPTSNLELRVICKDGNIRHICWMISPFINENLLYSIGRDITDRKKREEESLKQRDIMARIGRTTKLGQLTGSIAHELNQPLTGILSNAQAGEIMIGNDNYDKDEIAEILADIASDAKRAGEVIHSLRELYREQQGKHQPIDINTLVNETIKLIQSEFVKENVVIKTKQDSSIPMLNGNRIQIQQVLVNLLTNGIQAMSGKTLEARLLAIVTESDKNVIKLWVEDCGTGIYPCENNSIFEPLATWKSGGTGMGLAISNSIIEAHGGKMWAENISKGGARVGFSLPALKEQEKI